MQLKRGIRVLNHTLLSSRGRELTAVELLVIEAIWQDVSYQQVSTNTNYQYTTIRNASSRLFKDIEVAVGKSVSKKNCKSIVFSLQDNTESQVDLADAPTEIQPFCGRKLEITQIGAQILDDRAKVVALLGIGGIGKTAIAARLAQSLSTELEFVIWRSLREAPPPSELFAEIVQFLSKYTEIELPSRGDRQILHIR
jgi:ATP-dependent Clp protease ATP-binding subunit ClpA